MLVVQSKKKDYDTKISEIKKTLTDHNHDKYITTPEFNKFNNFNSTSFWKSK